MQSRIPVPSGRLSRSPAGHNKARVIQNARFSPTVQTLGSGIPRSKPNEQPCHVPSQPQVRSGPGGSPAIQPDIPGLDENENELSPVTAPTATASQPRLPLTVPTRSGVRAPTVARRTRIASSQYKPRASSTSSTTGHPRPMSVPRRSEAVHSGDPPRAVYSSAPAARVAHSPPPNAASEMQRKQIKSRLKAALSSGKLNLDSFFYSEAVGDHETTTLPPIVFDVFDPDTAGKVFEESEGVKWYECMDITRVSFANNNLAQISPRIRFLPNIVHLDLRGNCLSDLPKEIGTLESLRHLNLGHNKFTHIPECLVSLHSLTDLVLKNNNLSKLDSSDMPRLPRTLVSLDVSKCKLTCLSNAIFTSEKLAVLNASNNMLTRGFELQRGDTCNLRELDLKCNRISGPLCLTSGDGDPVKLPRLTTLDITQNAVTSVNVALPVASALLLSMNQLKSSGLLPALSGSLQVLDVSNNKLESLPDEILLVCKDIERLDVSNNSIVWFQPEIANLRRLQSFSVYGNPTRNLPKSGSMSDILDTLRRRLEAGR